MQKIAVYHNLPSGGAKKILIQLTKELARQKNQIYLYTPESQNNLFQIQEKKNLKIHLLNEWNPKTTREHIKTVITQNYETQINKLAKKIDRQHFDFVILGGDKITQTSILSKFLKTRNISIIQEYKREYYERTEWNLKRLLKQSIWKKIVKKVKKLELEALNSTNQIITNSLFSFRNIKQIVKNPNINILYPFIDFSSFQPKDNGEKGKFYLSIGTLSYLKGFKFIIKALSSLPKELQYPLIIITPGGPHKKNILNLASSRKIKIIIKEKITNQEIYKLYQSTSLFLFFAHKEPFGLAPLEALLSGIPSLCINEGGFCEIAIMSNLCNLIPRNVRIFKNSVEKILGRKYINDDSNFKEYCQKKLSIEYFVNKFMEKIKDK